jgi:hypothetical protein
MQSSSKFESQYGDAQIEIAEPLEFGILIYKKSVSLQIIIFFIKKHKMSNKTYKFEAEIKKVPDIDGAYIVFPYDIRKEFSKGRVKVHVLFDGVPYDGSIVNMGMKNADGSVCYMIGILKEIRKKINKQAGDTIEVIVNEINNF